MENISENQTKQQIILSATGLFAAKGFHGTSVEEVARHAGVNKATIYYYFSSKQAVLDNIIEGFLDRFTANVAGVLRLESVQQIFLKGVRQEGETFFVNDGTTISQIAGLLDTWLGHMLQLFEDEREILRIMFAESVKDGENKALLLRLSDILASGRAYGDMAMDKQMPQLFGQTLVMKFFGGLLPLAYYAVCEDTWQEHYGMKKEVLQAGLTNMFRAVLLGYFRMDNGPKKNSKAGEAPCKNS